MILQSLKKNKTGIVLMIFSSLCACTGQLFWKIASEQGPVYLIVGFMLYGAGALVMIAAYKFGSLSVLQPILSLNYVFTIFLAATVLKETLTAGKITGILIIIISVILIGGGDD